MRGGRRYRSEGISRRRGERECDGTDASMVGGLGRKMTIGKDRVARAVEEVRMGI